MVGMLGLLFCTAGHTVRTQHCITASDGQLLSDVEIRSYLQDQEGSLCLVLDLSISHDRFCSNTHIDHWKLTKISDPKIALIPYHHRFSPNELFGFIFLLLLTMDLSIVLLKTVGKMKPKS